MKPCTCVVSGLATGPKDYRPTEPQKENREKEVQETALSHMRALLVSKHKRISFRSRKAQIQVSCQRLMGHGRSLCRPPGGWSSLSLGRGQSVQQTQRLHSLRSGELFSQQRSKRLVKNALRRVVTQRLMEIDEAPNYSSEISWPPIMQSCIKRIISPKLHYLDTMFFGMVWWVHNSRNHSDLFFLRATKSQFGLGEDGWPARKPYTSRQQALPQGCRNGHHRIPLTTKRSSHHQLCWNSTVVDASSPWRKKSWRQRDGRVHSLNLKSRRT